MCHSFAFQLMAKAVQHRLSKTHFTINYYRQTIKKYSKDEIVKLLSEQQADFSCEEEKLVPKSFHVYKTSDLTDNLQVALVAKQISIDKKIKAQ